MRKKNNEVYEEMKIEDFVIPQIVSPYKGVNIKKQVFEPSKFVSAIFGTGQKDEVAYDDASKAMGDTDRKYDSFRNEEDKKIKDEEMFAKHGTLYPEFDQITLDDANKIYGSKFNINKKPEEVKVEKKEELPTYNFVSEEVTSEETKEETLQEPKLEEKSFSFGGYDSSDIFRKFSDEEIKDLSDSMPDYFIKDAKVKSTVVLKNDKNNMSEEPSIFDDPKFENVNNEEKVVITPKNNFEPVKEIKPEVKEEVNNYFTESEESNDNLDENTNVSYEEMPSYEEISDVKPSLMIDKYKDYKLPPLSLLSKSNDEAEETPEWLDEKKQIINETLAGFQVEGEVTHAVCGPTFTRYEVSLKPGVNVNKILNIQNNLQMSLGVMSIRIQAPIPGKTTIGIEVPNPKRRTVLFGDIMSEEILNDNKPLNVPLGKDIDGNIIQSNIAKWPHGLVAGGTGSGKSVCINTIIASLILKNKPNDLKFIMIDPKYVELSMYDKLPHMAIPVIQDMKMAANALKWAVDEMNRRYTLFASSGKKDIASYNEKAKEDPTIQKMCYIVIFIDELAELMLEVGQEVEEAIQSIVQKARAAGIHLICATQRPDKDTIKGTIKANIGTRLAFRVSGQVNSQIILNETGAEALLGNGDMIFKESDISRRVQGSYIPDAELESIVDFITDEAMPDYQLTLQDLKESNEGQTFAGVSSTDEDPNTIYSVAKFCIEEQGCSINKICQVFPFGFNRAQAIVNKLEELGVVSGRIGNKRNILMNLTQLNDLFEREE